MIFLRTSLNKNEQYSACVVFFGILLLGCIIVTNPSCAIDAGEGPDRGDMKELETKACCTCTRELWTVLFGGATTLASLLVSLGGWYHCDFHKGKRKIFSFSISPFRAFTTIVAGSLMPQIFMSFVLSSALAAAVLRQRVEKCKRGLANKICTMVVWICIDEATHKSLFPVDGPHSGMSGLFPVADHEKVSKPEEAPGIEDALFFKQGKSLRGHHTSTAEVNPPGLLTGQAAPKQDTTSAPGYYYLCSQSWDPKHLLWKEAMINTAEVLPEVDELEMIRTRTKWECVVVAVQSFGYVVSLLSRFAYGRGARVSSVEVMSAWISIALIVQVLIIPTLASYCNRGICLYLSDDKLRELVDYYEKNQERHDRLNWQTLAVLVLSLGFLCALFLILIPPLIHYYYRLSSSVLTFVSLIPFTIISAIAIMAFVLTLIFPPHDVIFAFVAFPFLKPPRSPPASKHMPVISVGILLVGLSCYVLAVIDTTINWRLFHARDCYMSNFIIPHIGSI